MLTLATVFVVAIYIFGATMLLANVIVGQLWLAGYWVALAPVVVMASARRVQAVVALFG